MIKTIEVLVYRKIAEENKILKLKQQQQQKLEIEKSENKTNSGTTATKTVQKFHNNF